MNRYVFKFSSKLKKLNKFLNPTKIGKGPVGLIDVGSIGGLEPPWDNHVDKVRYLLNFEPNDTPVRKKNTCTYNTALWEENADLPFYIYKGLNATGSSLFEQNIEYVDSHWDELKELGPKELANTWHDRSQLIKTTTLKCRTLDDVLASEGISDRLHFLKIDAQGAESRILKGSTEFLSNQCVGIQLELFNLPLYKGIALKPDVVDFLEKFGFSLVLEMPPHGTFDSQNDCIFLHKDRGTDKIRNAICEIYGISK